jgi:GNAT superfamily N-acetyltransferase
VVKLDLNWTFSLDPPAGDVQALQQKLRAHNLGQIASGHGTGLALFIHDARGQLVGGVAGYLWGACLEIDYLWLADELRGRGLGHTLLTRLESEAEQRGARLAVLDTYSFQSPAFYQHHGYEIFGVIDGYGSDVLGEGYKKYFMRKSLGS